MPEEVDALAPSGATTPISPTDRAWAAQLTTVPRPDLPALSPAGLARELGRMQLGCRLLHSDPSQEELIWLAAAGPAAFEQLLCSLAHDPADLRPGRLRAHGPVFRAYLCEAVSSGRPLPAPLAHALSLVEEGVRFDFVLVKERKTYARHQACVTEAQLRPSTVLLAPPETRQQHSKPSKPQQVTLK